jgi:serine/alanine adding enzyme
VFYLINHVAEIEFSWVSDMAGLVAPVYMGHAYQNMLSINDASDARLLKCRAQNATSYLPMLIRDLGDGCKEAYSAYGYGGLLGNLTLREPEADQLRRFLASEAILAIFIRHSPFLSNHAQWPSGSTELNRHTYSAALQPSDSFETYLTGIPQKLRWSVNYASRAGLRVTFYSLADCSTERIRAFYQLYSGLMHQKQTSAYYLFSEDFFVDHARALNAHCELAEVHAEENGDLLAGAFFLLDETGWVHYHLSAATPSAMKLQGMELLMASALQRYGNSGYRNMHLGGGHALDESDGLSRFKSKYSTERLDFFCTKLVCDVGSYQSERAKVPLKNPAYFLISDARGQ